MVALTLLTPIILNIRESLVTNEISFGVVFISSQKY